MEQIKTISDREMDAIEKLRFRMKNSLDAELYEDNLLFYRFLKARGFEINKAERMLRKHLIFRKAMKIDTILKDFKPKEAFKNIGFSYIGEDKEDNIVMYHHCGNIDVNDVVRCFKFNDYHRHWGWHLESILVRLKEIHKQTGNQFSKLTFIVDLDNLKLANVIHPATSVHLMKIAQNYQDNYPELIKQIVFINAPYYYVFAYSVVKIVIVKDVLRKIFVLGTSGWQGKLKNEIDVDILPEFLGGNRTDPDGNPMCHSFIHHSGSVSSKYYLSKEDRTFRDISRVKEISLSPGRREEIPVDITEHGCVIEWEFEVDSNDIQFGLYFNESDAELKELIPLFKFETPDGTEDSWHRCEWIGTYVIVFDNTHSRFTHKEVSYCITVKKNSE